MDEEKKIKVEAKYVSKRFELAKTNSDKLKSFFSIRGKKLPYFWALKDINFKVYDGDSIGIIGLNGSGKSTLSNIISGESLTPTLGSVTVNGQTSIIAIGAGLKAGLTGRENIRLKAAMMGMTNKEIKDNMQSIIDFSELGPFIDQPVKGYSAGMKAKLGFSIAVHQNPDILVIDEALSVGDSTFANKSYEKMLDFKKEGKTIFFISHSLNQVKKMCDKTMWIHFGELKAFGPTDEVIKEYQEFTNWFNKLSSEEQDKYKSEMRNTQTDETMDSIENKIVEKETKDIQSRSKARIVRKEIEKPMTKDNLSFFSKLIIVSLILTMIMSMLVATSGVSFTHAIQHPKDFFTNQLFKSKKSQVKNSKDTRKKESNPPASSKTKVSDGKIEKTEASSDYIVVAGDYLSLIAQKLGVSEQSIVELNSGVDMYSLQLGQVIKVPRNTTNEEITEQETTPQEPAATQQDSAVNVQEVPQQAEPQIAEQNVDGVY